LRELQCWIAEHPDEDLPVPALAARACLSPRQFARAFTAEVGMTPGQYVDRSRLETVRRLLVDVGEGIEQVARACGYDTSEAMRRAFLRTLGVGPAEYRRRF
jgi:transcriptional regulator GlxA family with amidase domain